MLLRLIPNSTSFKFIRFRVISMILSAALMVASIALYFVVDLNYGIDFKGGTMIEIGTEGPADVSAIRNVVGGLGLGDIQVQEYGSPNDVLIRIEEQSGAETERGAEQAQQQAVLVTRAALDEAFPGISYRRVEVVGPKVSSELKKAGTIAVVLAVMAVFVYIMFRFEWQFALGAVVALTHDVVLTIGIFSLLQLEFNLSIIAAILTIVGYSLNDTVVVYDRIRENLRKYKRMPLDELLDQSINDTLSRTVMTSVTTLLALSALYIWGGEVIRGFTFAMIWGVLVGTYSSIFIASPVLLLVGVKRDWSKGGDTAPVVMGN